MTDLSNYIRVNDNDNLYEQQRHNIYYHLNWKDKLKNFLGKYLALINFMLIMVLYTCGFYAYFVKVKPTIDKANNDMDQLDYLDRLRKNITYIINYINHL